jgi:hypothetical protein
LLPESNYVIRDGSWDDLVREHVTCRAASPRNLPGARAPQPSGPASRPPAQAARCRAGLGAGEDLYPAGEWAAREREALDALRVLAGFLELHAADPIAQAITTHLTPPASVAAKPGA